MWAWDLFIYHSVNMNIYRVLWIVYKRVHGYLRIWTLPYPKSSSKVERTGTPYSFLYAQCGLDRAAQWCRWMKIQPAVYDITPASPVWHRWMKHTSKNKARPFILLWLQRRVRHCDATERGHQEAESAVPERDAREEGVQRIQADEIGQSQKCKLLPSFWSTLDCI